MKVSVKMITYNHEKFVAQAVDSVLMQEVNFEYELVIGEDCSTDRTRDIVIDYHKKHPDKIRLLLPERNVGMSQNAIQTYEACRGEYIAMLEGDDYWTSPHKLQKQVDYLDSHPECAMCFHDAIVFYEDGSQGPSTFCPVDLKEISTLEDVLVGSFIPTCSMMFRRDSIDMFPDWWYDVLNADVVTHVLVAQHGKIGFIKEVMGAHRVHQGGVWGGQSRVKGLQESIKTTGKINAYLNFEYEKTIRTMLLKWWEGMANAFFEVVVEQGSIQAAIDKVMETFDHWPVGLPLSDGEKSTMLSSVYGTLGFLSYEAHDLPKARYSLLRAIRCDPSWLRNLGVWSILVEAFLGQRIATLLRRWAEAVYPGVAKFVHRLQTNPVRKAGFLSEGSAGSMKG